MTSSLVGLGDVYKRQARSSSPCGAKSRDDVATSAQGPCVSKCHAALVMLCLLYTSDAADDM
eukprot:10667625-Prorocentrum_lima.AAC.1